MEIIGSAAGVDKFGRNLLKIQDLIRKAAYFAFAPINGVTVVGAVYEVSVSKVLSNGTVKNGRKCFSLPKPSRSSPFTPGADPARDGLRGSAICSQTNKTSLITDAEVIVSEFNNGGSIDNQPATNCCVFPEE